jgi:fumarate hydratase class II
VEPDLFKPAIIFNALQSCRLLADAAESFAVNMVGRLAPNREHIAENPAKSLMLVTALNPRIGYDKAVRIGKTALVGNITLKHAAAKPSFVRPRDFDRWIVPAAMATPGAMLEGGGG